MITGGLKPTQMKDHELQELAEHGTILSNKQCLGPTCRMQSYSSNPMKLFMLFVSEAGHAIQANDDKRQISIAINPRKPPKTPQNSTHNVPPAQVLNNSMLSTPNKLEASNDEHIINKQER